MAVEALRAVGVAGEEAGGVGDRGALTLAGFLGVGVAGKAGVLIENEWSLLTSRKRTGRRPRGTSVEVRALDPLVVVMANLCPQDKDGIRRTSCLSSPVCEVVGAGEGVLWGAGVEGAEVSVKEACVPEDEDLFFSALRYI